MVAAKTASTPPLEANTRGLPACRCCGERHDVCSSRWLFEWAGDIYVTCSHDARQRGPNLHSIPGIIAGGLVGNTTGPISVAISDLLWLLWPSQLETLFHVVVVVVISVAD